MRTTVRLEPTLMRQLKRLAAETHRTLTSIIEDAVREVIARRRKRPVRASFRLPTFRGDGLQPGVHLDSTSDLLDRMEGR